MNKLTLQQRQEWTLATLKIIQSLESGDLIEKITLLPTMMGSIATMWTSSIGDSTEYNKLFRTLIEWTCLNENGVALVCSKGMTIDITKPEDFLNFITAEYAV